MGNNGYEGNFSAELSSRLNDLGREKPDAAANDAQLQAWKTSVWIVFGEELLFDEEAKGNFSDSHQDLSAAIEKFVKQLQSYDPEKGPLASYARKAIKEGMKKERILREIDQKAGGLLSPKEAAYYNRKRSEFASKLYKDEKNDALDRFDNENGYKTRSLTRDDGTEMEIPLDEKPEDALQNREQETAVQRNIIEMSAQIIQLLNNQIKDRANSTRKLLFPKWYSEKITSLLQEKIPLSDENTAFFALELSYLDYFLDRKCRTAQEIMDCPLRMEAEIDPNADSDKRLKWSKYRWLPEIVPICYLADQKSLSESTISRSRNDYTEFLMKIFEQKTC